MSLTRKLQSKVEDYIEEIANELNVSVPFYPQVYWVGRNFSFKKIGIDEKILEECYKIKLNFQSVYLPEYEAILIRENNIEQLSEEAGHFLHFSKTNIHKRKGTPENIPSLRIISEMFGYFCSKLVFPKRTNAYSHYPDPLFEKTEFEKFSNRKSFDKDNFIIHKQGYDLGEKLFDAYISRIIPKREIRKFFLMDFKEHNSALHIFMNLKMNILNFENRKFVC